MTKAITTAALAALLAGSPAFAQTAVPEGATGQGTLVTNDGQAKRYVSVTIFGDERCPTSNDPETIVVCRKGDPDRQFRIPSDLRSSANPTSNRTWGQRSRDVRTAGRSGPMSCSPVGPAGQSGCWADMMENWAADRTGNTGDGVVSPVEDN